MKVPTNNLHKLIQAMSASEKRYFKRHYSSEKNLTTELFDFINSQSVYDEQAVKAHFQNTKLSKNLKVYKVQLSDLLLKSLVSYNSKKSVKSKIRQGLEEIEILLTKQLYSLALGRCKKIRDLALAKEEYEYLLPVLQMEIYLNTFFNDQFNSGKMPQLDQAIEAAKSLQSLYELRKINFQLSDVHNSLQSEANAEAFQNQIETLLSGPLADRSPSGFHHEYYRNSSKAIIHKLAYRDAEQEYHFKKKNVELFLKHPQLIDGNAHTYFAAQYNLLVCCRALGKRNELHKGLQNIRALIDNFPSLRRNLLYVLYLEAKITYLDKNYQRLKDRIEPEALKHINKYNQEEENLTALIQTYFVLTNLILQDYRQVHFLLRRLFAQTKSMNANYSRMFDLLELISHYESNDKQIALKLINGHRRKLRSSRSNGSVFYKYLLEAIHGLIRAESEQLPKILKNSFTDWKEFSSDGFYLLAKEFFLLDWQQSVLRQIPFHKHMS